MISLKLDQGAFARVLVARHHDGGALAALQICGDGWR